MWTCFKIINLFWLLASTNMWPTAMNPNPFLPVVVNVLMLIVMGFLPLRLQFGLPEGRVFLVIIALTIWSLVTDEVGMSVTVMCSCLPVMYLIQLPYSHLKDLLHFVTKWLAILLIPGILIYWALFFINIPSLGMLTHPNYVPYNNYVFFIQSTWDNELFPRFNAFFLEPGHLSLLCTFLIMANRFRFRSCPWLWVVLTAVVFSFSLAGYILLGLGYLFISINSIGKLAAALALAGAFIAGVLVWNGGDNAMNQMIFSRMEYDQSTGIKGNNRFFDNTDYDYSKALGTKYFWISVKGKANMKLIGGAGYKIYILQYGMIGVILAFLFYLSMIPPNPDWRYTIGFLLLFVLCFMQRAYPLWYSWLFPYVVGIYLAKVEKHKYQDVPALENSVKT